MFTKKSTTLFFVVALALLPIAAGAQNIMADQANEAAAKKAALQAQWKTMTPQQKADFKTERRSEALAKWNAMTPNQKAAEKANAIARYNAMSPEKQAAVNAAVKQGKNPDGTPIVPLR